MATSPPDLPGYSAGLFHDRRFLDRALPAPVVFDDRRLKGPAPQLRYLEIDLAGAGRQRPIVTAGSGVLSSLAPFITSRPAKLVRLSIQHRVQRLLHRTTNHLAKMVSDPGFIDLDHLTHRILRW